MPRALIALCALVAMAMATQLIAVGASSIWSTHPHDGGRSARDPDQRPVSGIAPTWTAAVYAATENNTIYAFDTNSGAMLWQRHLASPAR
jgi:outer membrane protein assembly factor BamB